VITAEAVKPAKIQEWTIVETLGSEDSTGIAAAIGFRMNLFNIGVEGQYLIAAFFAVSGVVQIVWAVTGERQRLWLGLSGTVALLLAIMLWTGLPFSALWAVAPQRFVDAFWLIRQSE
jgi:uncharacterized membrane protein HdeD (DUF308 family)